MKLQYFFALALIFLAVQLSYTSNTVSKKITDQVYAALNSRLQSLRACKESDQPLFLQKNSSVIDTDLVEAVYINDDPCTLDALTEFYNRDEEPVYTTQQLEKFLAADLHTASVWRNRTSTSCIITVNTRRMEAATFGIEHEITHVMQHAEIACIGEVAFIKDLYKKLGDKHPEAVKEIISKYPDYTLDIERLEIVSAQERFSTVQVLLEYDADINAAELLTQDAETIKFITSRVGAKRCKPYASYELLHKIMQ